ncbi:MAG: hypothetical protein HKO58_00760, partial [Gammaproteobacteria bacterium]|nr:hypothetical protein [Gammaproteobacteria bacterium]
METLPNNFTFTRVKEHFASLLSFLLLSMLMALFMGMTTPVFAKPAITIDQCSNGASGQPPSVCTGSNWQNGNLNPNNSHYVEGNFVPYRSIVSDLTNGETYSVLIQWDATQGDKHAIDYISSFNLTESDAVPCDIAGVDCGIVDTEAIPVDTLFTNPPYNASPFNINQIPGEMTLFGGDILSIGAATGLSPTDYTYTPPANGMATDFQATTTTDIWVTFEYTGVTGGSAILAWSGHISTREAWGEPLSAIFLSGSPYHMRVEDFTCSNVSNCGVGNQDRSLKVSKASSITVIKDTDPDDPEDFSFS